MQLVQTLESQHRLLEMLVNDIQLGLKARDAQKISVALQRFHDALDAHLKLEDAYFYPPMVELARKPGNESKLNTVTLFANNMKVIADGLGGFYGEYLGKTSFDLEKFAKDWAATVQILVQRIQAEESTLHPLYGQLRQNADGLAT